MTAHEDTILVIDDREDNRELLRVLLQARGYHVVLAEDGSDALASVESTTPDLVLLDLEMPGIDGLTFLQRFRESLWQPSLP